MMISVAAVQSPIGDGITLENKLHLFRHRPDFVCLPEYVFVRPTDLNYADGDVLIGERLANLQQLSYELACVLIGGTIPQPIDGGGYGNITTVFNRGAVVGTYQKVNPFGHEEERGIVPGKEFRVFDVAGVRIGLLICADVLDPESFAAMGRLGAEVIFVPAVSPYRNRDTVFDKDRRDAGIFVAGAQKARAYVVKACGVGTIFGGRLQGRSAIFAPWGVLKRVPPDSEDRRLILSEHLDIDEIREFKRMMDPSDLAGAPPSEAHSLSDGPSGAVR